MPLPSRLAGDLVPWVDAALALPGTGGGCGAGVGAGGTLGIRSPLLVWHLAYILGAKSEVNLGHIFKQKHI